MRGLLTHEKGDFKAATILDKFARVTPILTVFLPNGSEGLVSEVEAQLTCMKVIVNSVKGEETKDSGENAGGIVTVSFYMLVSIITASFYLVL